MVSASNHIHKLLEDSWFATTISPVEVTNELLTVNNHAIAAARTCATSENVTPLLVLINLLCTFRHHV